MKVQGVTINLLLTLLILIIHINQAYAINPGEPAPGFSLLSSGENSLSFSDYSGKVVYLDFWASWCAPCRNTLPWMSEIQNKYGSDKFSVLAINLDKDPQKGKQIVAELGINFPVIYDSEGKFAKQFQLPAMPTSFLINQKGQLVASYLGLKDGDPKKIESSIKRLLLEGPR